MEDDRLQILEQDMIITMLQLQ
ncbi:hypothetical protein Goarm_000297 [Gossypium armourianum]|uniref:Uncharacterized protein n=1 Tax=Gossypium armourianum TaxID=34283 RepID=A0A7J9KA07_9ROSI|nr:hypothetical protein [Gossypium armourianum]